VHAPVDDMIQSTLTILWLDASETVTGQKIKCLYEEFVMFQIDNHIIGPPYAN
jgi:hypothetical protein